MPEAAINGIRLYYESHGDGAPLVFAHGAGGNHLSWWQQVPFFRERYRCIVFDQRGFGRSTDIEGGPGWGAHCDDLRALLDELGIEKAALVAQSMGGRTCMGFAAAFPERVTALVMADTMLGMTNAELAAKLRAHREGQGGPQPLQGRTYSPRFVRDKPALAFLYDSIMANNPAATGARPVSSDEPYVATDEKLAQMRVPALFIAGAEDVIFPPEILRFAAALVPGARYEEVPGCGHSVYFEDADAFNRIVAGFLSAAG